MSFETSTHLLANGDWFDLVWLVVLIVIYGGASVVKAFANRTKEKSEEANGLNKTAASERIAKPRYKPLDEAARPRPETPQARTLPYARTVSGSQPDAAKPMPAARSSGQMSEWDRHQEIKRRRQEQIEALRRQQASEQQRRQIQQQATLQEQRELQQRQQQVQRQQQASQPMPAQRPRTQNAPAARSAAATVRKAQQEALRRVGAGGPAGGGVLSRHSVLKQSAVTPVQRAAQAAEEAVRQDKMPASVSATLRGMLRRRDSLRSAFVLKEILDEPLGLRN